MCVPHLIWRTTLYDDDDDDDDEKEETFQNETNDHGDGAGGQRGVRADDVGLLFAKIEIAGRNFDLVSDKVHSKVESFVLALTATKTKSRGSNNNNEVFDDGRFDEEEEEEEEEEEKKKKKKKLLEEEIDKSVKTCGNCGREVRFSCSSVRFGRRAHHRLTRT